MVAATGRELAGAAGADTLVCGIGPVEAAAATARALADRRPDAVLHVGVAGARGLDVGTLVLGTEAVYCDLAAAIPVVDRALPDTALLASLRAAFPDAPALRIGTSAGGGASPRGLRVEAMEGFGVLRAAELAGVPAGEARVVAIDPDVRDRGLWRLDEALAGLAERLPQLVDAVATT